MKGLVLITGASGFVGRHVTAAFGQAGWETVPLDGRAAGDLRDATEARGLLRLHRPDVVVHLAANCGGIGINRAKPAEFFRDNLLMGVNVIDACLHAGVSRVVVAGSVCAYPLAPPVPFREESLHDGYPEPTNAPYGLAKRALLTMLDAYRSQHGLSSCYLLPTNLYGPGDYFEPARSHVIPALIRKFADAADRRTPSVPLWGTGQATRDFLYVTDAAEAFVRAAEHNGVHGPVNLGTGREVSIREVAEMVAHVCRYTGEVVWQPSEPDGQPRRVLDSGRALRELGWRATTPLEIGLRETVAWWRERACAA